MQKKQIKSILPSLRERKRYLAFKINSKARMDDFNAVKKEIMLSATYLIGELGLAKANISFFREKFKENKGLIMVNHNCLDQLRASLAMVKSIAGIPVAISSIGASGMIKKAEKYLD